METLHSANFYEENFDRFSRMHPNADLEKELDRQMKLYDRKALTDEIFNGIRFVEAQKIAEDCRSRMLLVKKRISDLLSHKTSIGYTTKRQGVEAMYELRTGFEFTCYCLSKFKKAHGLN